MSCLRWRVAINSSRYGFALDEEVEAADADELVLRLRELAAETTRRGEAKSVPSFSREAAAQIVESTAPLAFCRYVAQEWNHEHADVPMPVEFAAAADFVAAAQSVGLLRPC
ncbi:hypothetical protein AMK68_00585 [candidate division KD3-62 bacterium DG_56]|uniref:Uncharacterized protein n=1 Tax=candidate division KD3-62 bacterium DG_56 TaxID=1704032 RepID=A0A0S7XRE3_9BACT|nr:MAG: hypothetical protein AMK68_00585 [candidate division KD3-62 bacterium DG_56]